MEITQMPFDQIFNVPVAEILPAHFNPAARTQSQNLRELRNLIQKYGFRVPIQFSRDGILGDGHRRVACAKSLGLTEVPAIRQDLSVDEIFELNNGQRKITDKELLDAYRRGYRNILPSKLARIQALRDLIGDEGISRLADLQISPHILSMARMIANYCEVDDEAFTRQVIWWLVDTKQQFIVRRAISGGIDPEVLELAVHQGRKISHRWDTV